VERGASLISSLSKKIEEQHHVSLSDAPVSSILQQLADSNINTLYIQQEPDLQGWEDRTTQLPDLLIGDVEYESVIWRNGLETVSAAEIAAAFDSDAEYGAKLKNLYGILPTRPSSSKNGALDFVTDTRFALPVEDMSCLRRATGKTTYQYVFDQPNPWQSSSRAHHAVDLIFLFGGYDLSTNPAADKIGFQVRDKWIRFINGEKPWEGERRFAFGPHGKCGEIDDEEFAARRRASHFEPLREMGPARTGLIVAKLTAGRISLSN
jgi:carboxylesterase type B